MVPVRQCIRAVDATYSQAHGILSARFPEASVQHIGSTALAPLLCRSEVDLELAVDASKIAKVSEAIEESRELEGLELPIQVSVRDRDVPSDALVIRSSLAQSPLLLGEFRGLQKRFADSPGNEYSAAKQAFFTEILAQERPVTSGGPDNLPYGIALQSERMRIRTALSTDAEAQREARIRNFARIEKFSGSRHDMRLKNEHWETLATAEHILRWNHKALTFLFFRKSDSFFVGACHFSGFVWGPFRSCNIGYQIDGCVEGKGYMKEAATAALNYVFKEWGIHRVVANYDADNTRSGGLLKRLGFEVEGCARDWIELKGKRRDAMTTALLRSDWELREK